MTERSPLRRRLVATVLASALAVTPALFSGLSPVLASANVAAPIVHRYSLGSMVRLTTYRFGTGPEQVRVIRIIQGAASLDIVNASSGFGVQAKPSAIASKGYFDGSSYGPGIAATNGDFTRNLMPVHLEEIAGQMMTTGLQSSPQFALNADGSHAYIGKSRFSFAGTYNSTKFSVDAWNSGGPARDQIAGYSSVGGSVQLPPGTASPKPRDRAYCAVLLLPSAEPKWSNRAKASIERTYTINAVGTDPCPQTPMSLGTNPDAVVLASAAFGAGATTLKSLATCSCTVTLSWGHNHWPGVVDAIGGTPVLVDNGVNVGPGFNPGGPYFFNYNPRTAIGFNANCSDTDLLTLCKVYLVTVDGRQSTWSAGWRMNQLGAFFVNTLHAQYALNLDGGGSTVSWVHQRVSTFTPPCIESASAGCLVDKPADGLVERPTIMALVAIPGADLGVPPSLR